MRINNKNLAEIFADIPLPQKIVVVAGICFIFFVIFHVSYLAFFKTPAIPLPVKVTVSSGTRDFGQLDPSMAAGGNTTLMSYTEITEGTEEDGFATRISLAVTHSKCKLWNKIAGGFDSNPDELIGPDEMTPVKKGIWRFETSSLVHDPEDTGREWKLYAYKYFWGGTPGLARLYGMIVQRTSTNPISGQWSDEEWLFAASPQSPPQPYNRLVKARLSQLDPSLANVYFYARPSVIRSGGVLLMSLSAFIQGKESTDRVVLLASSDHGKNWTYLGTPISESDVAKMGDYTRLNGGTLFTQDGRVYLSVVLGNKKSDGLGSFILDFESTARAQLRRDPKTAAIAIVRHIPTVTQPPTIVGGGQLGYNEVCPKSMFTSESGRANGRYDLYRFSQPPVLVE